MVAKKKGAGGSLTRSQIVTVRLDPKLKFAAELAARKQRRTISSFIEWAVEGGVRNVFLPIVGEEKVAIWQAMGQVWDVEEADRLVKLAIYYPELLSFEEEQVWKLIRECRHFWKLGRNDSQETQNNLELIYFDRVREQWENLHKVISGEKSIDYLNDLPVEEDEPF